MTGKGTSSTRAANRPRKCRASRLRCATRCVMPEKIKPLGLDHRGIPPFAKHAKDGAPGCIIPSMSNNDTKKKKKKKKTWKDHLLSS